METVRQEPSSIGGFFRAVSRVVRYRRRGKERGSPEEASVGKLKFSEGFNGGPSLQEEEQKLLFPQRQQSLDAVESFLAELFAGVAAIKASYAQLQFAQSPYDPETVQSADQIVVAELKQLSQLKHLFFHHISGGAAAASPRDSLLPPELQEQKNLVKTFQITVKKLEAELLQKEAEILHLAEESLKATRAPPLSHFSAALQEALSSARSFSWRMMRHIELAGWDLEAAISAMGREARPEHRGFAFESFVCSVVFSGFHRRDFEESDSSPSGFAGFCRARYRRTVHPAVESSLSLASKTELFLEFAQMARRVWLLHRLFFSLGAEEEASIFQAERGSRISEVFMDSVVELEDRRAAVGFTVAPGFRLGKTIARCRVYPAPGGFGRPAGAGGGRRLLI